MNELALGESRLPHFTRRYGLAVLLGLVSVLALVLVGRWMNATKRGGQGPAEPFRIAGNLYYVGATDAAAFLVTGTEGHIVLDGGYPTTAPMIMASIAKLGFSIEDVKVLLNSEPHPDLPTAVRNELDRRGCTIPQTFFNKAPHNVVRGRFTSSSRRDLAVLCSREGVSSILVFQDESAEMPLTLATRPDSTFLQVVAPPNVVGYSRALGVATPEAIRAHYEAHGGPEPPPLSHDGIDDVFVEKASVVWYWHNGKWLRLTGAN